MKIALCSKGNFSLEKGFTKNRLELAECLQNLGWETTLVGKEKLGIPNEERYNAIKHSLALKDFLLKYASQFDVVLLEYDTLPFEREIFSNKTLFVARPAILAYHFSSTKFKYNLKTKILRFLKKVTFSKRIQNRNFKEYLEKITFCLQQADVIQVQNTKDLDLLVAKGFSKNKIEIIPNGITSERILSFKNHLEKPSEPFNIAFVGSFDFRKGAIDFPIIFKSIKKKFPTAKLKLVGTRGMFPLKEQVLNFFPKKYRKDIDVTPNFKAEELEDLIGDCHLGIFPSYLESFGFGALEMMGMGMPVVAYNAPGPCDFILSELLVPIGNTQALANKVIGLLDNPELLKEQSIKARKKVVDQYCWEDIAKNVDTIYHSHLRKLKAGNRLGLNSETNTETHSNMSNEKIFEKL